MKKRIIAVLALCVVLGVSAFFLMGGTDIAYYEDEEAIKKVICESNVLIGDSFIFPTETGRISDLTETELEAVYQEKVAALEHCYIGDYLNLYIEHCKNFYLRGRNTGSGIDYKAETGVNDCTILQIEFNSDQTEATADSQCKIWTKLIQQESEGLSVVPSVETWATSYALKKIDGEWKIAKVLNLHKISDGMDDATVSALRADPQYYGTFDEAMAAAEEMDLSTGN